MVMDPAIPEWIVADPTRLKQVIHNLLSNAITFTKTGSISLYIKFIRSVSTLQIEVVDTGEGITKNLVELMGGVVELQSTLGNGSRCCVTVVYQEYEGECESMNNRSIAVPKPILIPSLVGKVLLVEDTDVNQQLITFNLRQTGAQVDLAVNGLEGLQKALAVQYDLVLMDIQMPVMDGKEAMRSLLQLGVSSPIYAITANVMSSDIQEYAALGFTGALSKPLVLENLYAVLNQHLSVCDNKANKANNKVQQTQVFVPDPKVRKLFYEELAKQSTEITESIQNLDYAGLIKVTHIIQGSAGSFGYDELTNLAAQSLQLLRQKQYLHGIRLCINLNQKLAEVLNDYND